MSKFPRKAAAAAAIFTATLNLNGCVYGPPADFEDTTEIPYGYITEEFDPAQNINADVYGPPAYFGEDEPAADTDNTNGNGDTTNE